MLNSNAHHTVNARILTAPEPEVQRLAHRSVAPLHNTDRHDCTQQRQDGTHTPSLLSCSRAAWFVACFSECALGPICEADTLCCSDEAVASGVASVPTPLPAGDPVVDPEGFAEEG